MRIIFVVVVFLLLSSFAYAQKDFGAIEGTIADMDGRPIPGVMVTASSPSLIGGSRTAYTNSSGFYRFPAIASGIYEVKAELAGFQTMIRKQISLSILSTLTVDFTLQLSHVAEVVEVRGDRPPLIDTTTTAVTSTVPQEIVSNLPRRQDIQSLLALTPGVKDDLSAYGSDPQENSYWIDGVNMTSPSVVSIGGINENHSKSAGTLTLQYDQNWIDQLQVTGIGAPAEYGGFTGVVGNFVTKSGGNQFHGLYETLFQNQHMVSTNIPDSEGRLLNPDGLQKVPFHSYDISTQLGGPILRDKLWFFVGYQYPHHETPAFPRGWWVSLSPTDQSLVTETAPKMLNKLTYKWNEDNTLQGFVEFNRASHQWTYFPHQEVNTLQRDSQYSWNATWISLLNSNTTLESSFAGFHDDYKYIEDNPDLPGHATNWNPFFKLGYLSVNNCCHGEGNIHRLQSNVTLSHHAENFLHGNHDFRFGVQIERADTFNEYMYNGGMFYYDSDEGPDGRNVWPGYRYKVTSNVINAFAQDEWKITDRFTASAGFRWDHNRQGDESGIWQSNDQVAPRIGFIWNLDQNNQTVIKAHYGHYFEGLLYAGGVGDGYPWDVRHDVYYQGKWYLGRPYSYRNVNIPHGLKQPLVRQFDIGIDRVLPGAVPIGAHYIHRQWAHMIQSINQSGFTPISFINPISGQTITYYDANFNPGGEIEEVLANENGSFRHYDAIEVYGNKQFSNRFSLMGSLVYYAYHASNNKVIGSSQAGMLNFQPPFDPPPDNHLSIKLAGTYAAPFGFNATWFYRRESGKGWVAFISPLGPSGGFGNTMPGESCCRGYLDPTNLVDMRFEKEFPIYRDQELRFTIDVFNLFNAGTATAIDQFWGYAGYRNPNLGKPVAFVDPRQYRLGVRYTF